MQRISISQAAAGMVLAEPAESEQGMVICGAGTALTDSLLARFEKFGVTRLTVEGHPVQKPGESRSEEEQLAELEHRFAAHAADPVMMLIKDAFSEQLHERMADYSGEPGAPPPSE